MTLQGFNPSCVQSVREAHEVSLSSEPYRQSSLLHSLKDFHKPSFRLALALRQLAIGPGKQFLGVTYHS
jgi:hypothetical protein